MMIPKRRLLTLIFACLCFKKSFLIKTLKHIKREKGSLPVDVRRSETELLKLPKNGRELHVAYANLQGTSQSFEQKGSGVRLKAGQILLCIANLIISL